MQNKFTFGGGNERGAAMIEAAACLGLVVFLIQGIAWTCFSLSNLISVSQMAYSSAMAGIEVPGTSSEVFTSAMAGRANLMLGASKGQFRGQDGTTPFGNEPFRSDPTERLITVSLSPKLTSAASGPFAAIIGAHIVAPSIYPNHRIAEDLQHPANPVGRLYDCDGKITSNSPSQCASNIPPPSGGNGGGGGGGRRTCHSFCFIDAPQE